MDLGKSIIKYVWKFFDDVDYDENFQRSFGTSKKLFYFVDAAYGTVGHNNLNEAHAYYKNSLYGDYPENYEASLLPLNENDED